MGSSRSLASEASLGKSMRKKEGTNNISLGCLKRNCKYSLSRQKGILLKIKRHNTKQGALRILRLLWKYEFHVVGTD